ncbi:MAG: 50S ribosomal protein L34e [Sulfolobales archaeon]|nr:50S ribosomal protein L34e [Sulfolobales archaeon]
MPKLWQRSSSRRRICRRIPSGVAVVHYELRNVNVAKCSICGTQLGGIPRLNLSSLRKLAKTEKRPERIYGGTLCHRCLASLLKEAARVIKLQRS